MPPDVLWIMTDQHRLDCVGAYSSRPVRTPNLDRLAGRSVVFDRHYTTCPLCVPARSSLHTGRFPHSCGATINAFGGDEHNNYGQLNADEVTLPDLMAQAGYHVGHIGVDHVRTTPPYPQSESLSRFVDKRTWRQYVDGKGLSLPDMRPHQQDCPTRYGDEIRTHLFSAPNPARHPFAPEDFEDFYYARETADFIRNAPADQPLFAMCFLWMPHPPFVIPEPYYSMYSPDDVELPPTVGGPQNGKPRMHLSHLPGQVGAGRSQDEWRETWAAYYGCVTLADDCIGRVLDAVDERGGLDNTVVVFHPDHGEMLGAHSYFQKMVCYEESIHLPMMVSAPRIESGRRDCLTSHVDIAPTILELAGADIPERMQGHSLGSVLRNPDAAHHDEVFCEYNGNVCIDMPQRCVIRGDMKYIWNRGDIDELYDLTEDPLETSNLATDPGYQTLRLDLRKRLRKWMRETGDFLRLD